MYIIIGNVIAFIAAILMVIVGTLNDKKKALNVQILEMFLFSIGNLFLGGYTGCIANVIGIIRNILSHKGKLGIVNKIIIIVLSIISSIIFNNIGFIGILPILSSILFVIYINKEDIQKFKLLIIVTSLLWAIYDITIKLYTSFAFDILTILGALITLIINKKKEVV